MLDPQLCRAASRAVPISQATSSITPSKSRVKEVAGVAWEGVKTALVLLKESSDWFPPLKAAAGGLVSLIDALELPSANVAGLESLRQSVNTITSIIQDNSQDLHFPWLRRRLVEFAEKLNEITKSMDEKATHGAARRLAEGKKDKEDTAAFARDLSELIAHLQSELALHSCRAINDLLSNESLKKLKESESAHYDAFLNTNLVRRRGYTPKTREKILQDLMVWAKNHHGSRLYWMRDGGDGEDDDRLQLFWLISEPFRRISDSVTDTLIIVIDALDECSNGAQDIRLFLKMIYECFVSKNIPLKVFVTSRPEDAIRRTITPPTSSSSSEWDVVHIHDIEESLVWADIKVYVEAELAECAETWGSEDGWPSSTEVEAIVDNANKLFIYAATVNRYLTEDSGASCKRLSELASTKVGKGSYTNSSLTTELIDGLYTTILERALLKLNKMEDQLVHAVVKLIVCAQTPLPLSGIATLLNSSGGFQSEIPTSRVGTALKLLTSVISIPSNDHDNGVATTFHASFPDFLFDSRRSEAIMHIHRREAHQDLVRMCLNLMDKSLTVDNITGSDRWQSVDAITNEKNIENYISSGLGHACMFWSSYLDTEDDIGNLSMELGRFLTRHVLRWLEILSLLRRLDIGVGVLQRLQECNNETLSSKFGDAYKFLRESFDIINIWPCEVFHSALVWAPTESILREIYGRQSPIRIVSGLRVGWGACEYTIRGHSRSVNSVAVSPDNRHIVSASYDNTVRIWNASTGEEEHVLRGHSGGVNSVAVSHDNRHIVSGSYDKTVRIWNALTGEDGHVLRGHSGWVHSVVVSPDNRHVV